jgi:hypothetical protein
MQYLSAAFEVADSPEVTVDKLITTVGEPGEVTVTVTENGEPLANESISIEGYASGITDTNGRFTATITPDNHGSIPIKFREKYYKDRLYSLYSDTEGRGYCI